VAGVGGGVGTTTVAAALRGLDRGRDLEHGVDVLVCRTTGHSLQQAAVTVTRLAANGRPRPILAVTPDRPGAVRGAVRARLRMIEPQVAALVLLPYVPHWRELTDPLAEAAELSRGPGVGQPRPLRGYADALAGLAQRLVSSRLLTQPAPELPGRPGPGSAAPGRPTPGVVAPGRPASAPARPGEPAGPSASARPAGPSASVRPAVATRSSAPVRPALPAPPGRLSTAGPVNATAPVNAVRKPPRVRRPSTVEASHLDLPLARVAELGGGAR
jgi:hypothetical protein